MGEVAGGVVLALVLGRFLKGFFYGVESQDVLTLATATFGLLAVGALAAAVPAWRAMAVELAEVSCEE